MTTPGQGTIEGTGLAFSLARKIATRLLKRSVERRIRVIVEQEVQAAVLRHVEALQGVPQAGLTQIVVGEVYNIAERFDGVMRIGDELHLEEGAVSLEAVGIDDPRHTALVQRAQARLDAVGSSEIPHPETASPDEGEIIPTFDAEQRLSRQAAERYRERLQRITREGQVR
jgi:hypothetical protein